MRYLAALLCAGSLLVPFASSAQNLYTYSENPKNTWTPNGWAYPNANYSYTTTPPPPGAAPLSQPPYVAYPQQQPVPPPPVVYPSSQQQPISINIFPSTSSLPPGVINSAANVAQNPCVAACASMMAPYSTYPQQIPLPQQYPFPQQSDSFALQLAQALLVSQGLIPPTQSAQPFPQMMPPQLLPPQGYPGLGVPGGLGTPQLFPQLAGPQPYSPCACGNYAPNIYSPVGLPGVPSGIPGLAGNLLPQLAQQFPMIGNLPFGGIPQAPLPPSVPPVFTSPYSPIAPQLPPLSQAPYLDPSSLILPQAPYNYLSMVQPTPSSIFPGQSVYTVNSYDMGTMQKIYSYTTPNMPAPPNAQVYNLPGNGYYYYSN